MLGSQVCLGLSLAQPSPASISLLIISLVLMPALFFNLLQISCQLRQQPSLDQGTMSPLASAPQHFLRALLSQSLAAKHNHCQIFTEQTAASQGFREYWKEQSKCHSRYILIILKSLQMTLTSLCHWASYLLRAINGVLPVTGAALSHPNLMLPHEQEHLPFKDETTKAQRDGSACPKLYTQQGAKHERTQ